MRISKRLPGKDMKQALGATVIVALLSILACSAPAYAETPAPGWEVIGRAIPTNLPPGGEGAIELWAPNLGAGSGTAGAVLTDVLPEGLTATGGEIILGGTQECSGAGTKIVTCELPVQPARLDPVIVWISVSVNADASGSATDLVSVTGGGELTTTHASVPLTYGLNEPLAGFTNFDAWLTNADGTIDTQAGSHPYDLSIAWATPVTASASNILTGPPGKRKDRRQPAQEDSVGGDIRNINVNLPPGIVGDPEAVPQCTRVDFESGYGGEDCPASTMVGVNVSDVQGFRPTSQVYNLVPPPGVAAQFGFNFDGTPVFLDSGPRTGGDNGITTHVGDIPQRSVLFNITTIWGVPAEKSHDLERSGPECQPDPVEGIGCPAGVSEKPFLTLPTSCAAPPEFSIEMLGTWVDENFAVPPRASVLMHNNEGIHVGFTGCERLQPFSPSIAIAPDTTDADTPAGLVADVKMPQGLNPEGFATPNLKDTTVTLPAGIVINPGQATGLQACQASEEALGDEPNGEDDERAPSCPSASRVGEDEVTTPLLPGPLKGDVYVLGQSPPNLQLLMTASGYGVNLKLVGNVHLNEQTGQLTTTFENTPDFPFTEFKLAFSGGAQAALATPTACGVYEANVDFTPWSTPFIGEVFESSRFQITAGPGGSACQQPLPFAPTMTAGATTDQAGGYTDFTLLLTRGDGQQRIEKLQFKTPEGLLGMIAKVPLCPEPQAASGTCSEASQIGHTVAEAGPGPYPFVIPEPGAPPAPIYLTGPYEGAPFGLSIAVPVVAGPFNLGTEVVRGKIEVDPLTAQLTITTTPFPRTVKGIPTDIREIDAVIDRPGFMFNPTDCEPMSFSGTAYSTEGATAPLESHFQMGSCRALTFQPELHVSTPAKVSRTDGTSLNVKIVYPTGNLGANQASSQSNIKYVKVELPKQLPSRLTTLQKACKAAIFEANPANCPPESAVGHATAITPVLPVPVTGPAYFVSNGSAKFPELIVVLQGYGVTVYLHGNTFISKTGITSATFESIPDVPIGSFELDFPQGPYSALTGNGNLCTSNLQMPSDFVGQNGATLDVNTKISVTGCSAVKMTTKHTKKHKAGKHKMKHHKAEKAKNNKKRKG